MRKFVKKYWIGLLIYTILLIIFPHAVIGYSLITIIIYIGYKLGKFLGLDSYNSSNDDDDDDLTTMMLYHHYHNKHKD